MGLWQEKPNYRLMARYSGSPDITGLSRVFYLKLLAFFTPDPVQLGLRLALNRARNQLISFGLTHTQSEPSLTISLAS